MSVINLSKLSHKDEEIRTPARGIMIEKVCPKCSIGRMNATGRAAQTALNVPPVFEHVCGKCQHKEVYGKQYPRVEFEKIEQETEEKEGKEKN